jgi:hypothetical protein
MLASWSLPLPENTRHAVRRHLCVAVDAKDYSRLDAAGQEDLQAALVKTLDVAAERAGLERLAWSRQQQGDGELALVPADQDEKLVVDDFVRELDALLDRHNHGRVADARLRLRVAIHHGVAYVSENGYAGPAPVVVSRILASRELHDALAQAPGADLAVALSDGVYGDLVLNRLTSLRPAEFRCTAIKSEKYEGTAWIRVLRHAEGASPQPAPAHDAAALADNAAPGSMRQPGPSAGQSAPAPDHYQVTNNIHGGAQIGVAGFNIAPRER